MRIVIASLATLAFATLAACDRGSIDPGEIPENTVTGSLRVYLGSHSEAVDLDPAVDEVWVRLQAVLIRHDTEGWVDLAPARQDINLLDPVDVVAEEEVFVGLYEKLHFAITDTWIVADGVEEDLSFVGDVDVLDPLDLGLVVTEPFFVDEGSDTTVRVEWSLAENLSGDEAGWALGASTTFDVDIEDATDG